MVMNFPSAISPHDDLVRRGEEVARLGMLAGERAEDELRHRHVGRGVDAVPGDVAEHDREPAVVEREEVVDVAADLDVRRRSYIAPTSSPSTVGRNCGSSERCIESEEVLLLLVEARVVDRQRGLPAIATADAIVDSSSGCVRSSESSVSEPSTSAGVAMGTTPRSSRARGTARAGRASRRAPAPAATSSGIGSPFRKRAGARAAERLRAEEHRRTGASRLSSATCSACGSSSSRRGSGMRITAASTSRSSTTVRATASSVTSSERLCVNEREIS